VRRTPSVGRRRRPPFARACRPRARTRRMLSRRQQEAAAAVDVEVRTAAVRGRPPVYLVGIRRRRRTSRVDAAAGKAARAPDGSNVPFAASNKRRGRRRGAVASRASFPAGRRSARCIRPAGEAFVRQRRKRQRPAAGASRGPGGPLNVFVGRCVL
jgi:hypothetical protein